METTFPITAHRMARLVSAYRFGELRVDATIAVAKRCSATTHLRGNHTILFGPESGLMRAEHACADRQGLRRAGCLSLQHESGGHLATTGRQVGI